MLFFRRTLPVLVLALTLTPAFADDPFLELHQYDYQNRKPLDTIAKQIQAAGLDRAKLNVIETGLVGVLLDAQATLAGKQEACTLLGGIGTKLSLSALVKLLQDPATVNIARLALERNPDPIAGAMLRAHMGVAKGPALAGVINSVGNRGDAQAVGKLKSLATSPDPLVADAAVGALGKIGTPAAVAALRTLNASALPVSRALLQAASKLALAGKPSEALSLYESLLAPTGPEVIRAGALTGLEALSAPRTGELALALAASAPEPTLQRVAGRVLGMSTAPASLSAALTAFAKLPAPAQTALLSAWGDRKELGATEVVAGALKSPDAEVRGAAIRTAARTGGAGVVPVLAELASGGESARVARETLAGMGGKGVEEALLTLTQQGNLPTRTAIIGVLGQRVTAKSTARLLQIATGSEPRPAVAALKVLEKTATLEQEGTLVTLLASTGEDEIRDAAQGAIVAIAQRSKDPDRAAQPLLAAMQAAMVPGKVALIGALAEVGGDRALGVITEAAVSGEGELKSAALAGLANSWGDARALPTLLQIAKTSTDKSDKILALRGCLRVLAADERAPVEQKLAQLTELFNLAERPEEKRQALGVLREIRLPGAAALATKALESPELVAEAADAILYLAAPQKKDRATLAAVKGAEMMAALDKVLTTVADEKMRALAQKLKSQ